MDNFTKTEQKDAKLTPNEIANQLTKESKKFEQEKGILNIMASMDKKLRPDEGLFFIDSYRHIIRENKWHYDDEIETDFQDFLNRWITTHKFYIQIAKEAYDYFTNKSKKPFYDIHSLVIVSESFRGREGKRSKIGLDHLLDSYVDKLTRIVQKEIEVEEIEDVVGLFTTTISLPYISAEYELFLDFYNYKKSVNEALNQNNFESIEKETKGLCSKILREYCKYSIADFNEKFSLLKTNDDIMLQKGNFLKSIRNEREILKNQIYDSLLSKNGKEAKEFLFLLERINDLNYLNANLEVKFSFKGWPGLFHHLIFEKGRSLSTREDLYHRHSDIMLKEMGGYRWNLIK